MTFALRDTCTMLGRNLRHLRRYPGLSVFPILLPVVFLLLFVFVFGGTLGDGLPGGGGGRDVYLDFLTPGMLLFTVAGAAQITAISVAMDMTEGIVARFKTLRIWRPSMVAGHILGTMLLTLVGLAVLVLVAVLIGFRSPAGPLAWLAATGLLVLASLALLSLSAALGLLARSVETASNMPMFLTLLPFFGSGFVPVDSMPGGVRWFAAHQPFTPITDTLRRLLGGEPVGTAAITAVLWCLGITLVAHLWACRLYDRRPAR